MKITRLYSGTDGQSYFEDLEVPLTDTGPIGRLSQVWKAGGVVLRETGPDYDLDWHHAPRRQLVIMLEGEVDIEIGDGTVRRFGPGDIVLAEDTAGQGHRSRAVGGNHRKSAFVILD